MTDDERAAFMLQHDTYWVEPDREGGGLEADEVGVTEGDGRRRHELVELCPEVAEINGAVTRGWWSSQARATAAVGAWWPRAISSRVSSR